MDGALSNVPAVVLTKEGVAYVTLPAKSDLADNVEWVFKCLTCAGPETMYQACGAVPDKYKNKIAVTCGCGYFNLLIDKPTLSDSGYYTIAEFAKVANNVTVGPSLADGQNAVAHSLYGQSATTRLIVLGMSAIKLAELICLV